MRYIIYVEGEQVDTCATQFDADMVVDELKKFYETAYVYWKIRYADYE